MNLPYDPPPPLSVSSKVDNGGGHKKQRRCSSDDVIPRRFNSVGLMQRVRTNVKGQLDTVRFDKNTTVGHRLSLYLSLSPSFFRPTKENMSSTGSETVSVSLWHAESANLF